MDPFAVFPPEIWELIFDKVEEPQVWYNLHQASPSSFHGIVGKRRTTVLFQLVFPYVRPYLMYLKLSSSILTLRLVSKRWKLGVDTGLECLGLIAKNFRCNLNYDFWRRATLSSFLDKFSSDHHPGGNPIIGRSVRFCCPQSSNPQRILDYRALVSRAMDRFGVHLKKLAIHDFTMGDTSHDNFLLRLANVVEAAPALESLSLAVTHKPEENNSELIAFVKNTPLPARPVISGLKSLYLLRLGDYSEFMANLQNLVISTVCSPDSLRKVNVVGVPEALVTFSKVENATVYLRRPGDHLKLTTVSWPLTSLTLNPDDERRGIRFLLEVAEHFKDTLTSLTIYNHLGVDVDAAGQNLDFRVELPHLQTLQISQMVSFDIFENLGSLQVLAVFNSKWLNRETKAGFVEDVRRELERSSSWELLPKLMQVVLKGTAVIETENDPISFRHRFYRDR